MNKEITILNSLLKETIQLSKEDLEHIREYKDPNSRNLDYLNFHFLDHSTNLTSDLDFLLENNKLKSLSLISRAIIELSCNLEYIYEDPKQVEAKAEKWRLFGIYEDFMICKYTQGEKEMVKLIDEYKKEYGNEVINKVINLYPPYTTKTGKYSRIKYWSKAPKEIIKKNYKIHYAEHSCNIHCTPRGIINDPIDSILASTLCALIKINQIIMLTYDLPTQSKFDSILKKLEKISNVK